MEKTLRIEHILLVTLSLFAASLFFSQSGISIFGPLSLLLLVFWRFKMGYEPAFKAPRYVEVAVAAFVLSLAVSIYVSQDRVDAFSEFRQVWYYFFAIMLATCPMSAKTRLKLLTVFFLSAFASGLFVLWQQVSIEIKHPGVEYRASGFTHPVHMAGILATACFALILAFIVPNNIVPRSGKYRAFMALAFLAVLAGLAATQTRGVWVAFTVSCAVTLLLLDKKKAFIFVASVLVFAALAVGVSDTMKLRFKSIAASLHNPASGELGPRFVLWQGALIMFRESPVVGTGSGDWDEINELMEEGRVTPLEKIHRVQAHNLYFHWLGTQGAVGLVSLLMFLGALLAWGYKMLDTPQGLSGYLLIMLVVFSGTWGLLEANLLISKFVAICSFTFGLLGGFLRQGLDEGPKGQ